MLFLEFEYSNAVSPSCIGYDLNDHRVLCIGFRSIKCSDLNIYINFQSPVIDDRLLYGFHRYEKWGRWSSGSKSCILLTESSEDIPELNLTINAFPFRKSLLGSLVNIKSSAGHFGYLKINGFRQQTVKLKKSKKLHSFLLSNFPAIDFRHNVSLKDELPKLSIIIINYNKYHLTKFSVLSSAASATHISHEIICVDNNSSSEVRKNLRNFSTPMRLIELNDNLGYGPANNLAAKSSRGEYLLLLNNDAFLNQAALIEMLEAFEQLDDCWIVGPTLRFPDGSIQEAGAFLQTDAHPIQYGRNNQNLDILNFPRFKLVDYVSGACLMIKKDNFLELGGFSDKFAPAYYEDTDLCMRALLYNKKVYLSSRANCYHIENATTSNIENGDWATRTAELHRQIFLKDWADYLANRHPSNLPIHLMR